jgi:hypothetical protein
MKHLSQLASDLETRALAQDVISYNKYARLFGLGKVTPENYRSHPFCDAFGQLDDEDIRLNRPFRTALVFSEVLNRPGHGFFEMLSKRRGVTINEESQYGEWIEELNNLQTHYKSNL